MWLADLEKDKRNKTTESVATRLLYPFLRPSLLFLDDHAKFSSQLDEDVGPIVFVNNTKWERRN